MNSPSETFSIDPISINPRAARLVEAFKDALIRMRDGEELTSEDLNTTTELLEMVQAPTGAHLAAAAMPLFSEVFQNGRDGISPDPTTLMNEKE
jgi:catechol 1,2-dioxygenase